MDGRIGAVLAAIRQSLPLVLVDDASYARLAVVAEALPADLTTFWGLEIRLGESEADADILFQTQSDSSGQRLLAGLESSPVGELVETYPAWTILRDFARHWSDSNHAFHDAVRNVWLEFDTAGSQSQPRAALATPSIFIGPGHRVDRDQLPALLADVLSSLGDDGWPAGQMGLFMETLPEGAALFQMGLMLSRPTEGLRVCVDKLPLTRIPGWLAELDWSGDVDALESLLERLEPMVKLVSVAMNLTRGDRGFQPDAKIGLECYRDWAVDDVAEWEPFLRYLREQGLCLPAKLEGLLRYPGLTPLPWPRIDTERGLVRLGAYRKIHHVKLDVIGDRVVRAKAYLAVSHPIVHLRSVMEMKTEEHGGNKFVE